MNIPEPKVLETKPLRVYADEVVIEYITGLGQGCGRIAIPRRLLHHIVRLNHEVASQYGTKWGPFFHLVDLEKGVSRTPTINDL